MVAGPLGTFYKPWHARLRGLMQRAERHFGSAVLIDCHSMPSSMGRGARPQDRMRADVVLGDRYGTSCDPMLTAAAEACLKGMGYQVLRNKPFAGGFITEHYGNPQIGWHALQIEVSRGIYMDETTLERGPGFAPLARDLAVMAQALAETAAAGLPGRRAAAE